MKEPRLYITGIGIVGLPGSGKSAAARLLSENLKINIIVMGDVVRDEAKRRGIPEKPEKMRELMKLLRTEQGVDVVAQKCLQKLETMDIPQNLIIIDGLRSNPELLTFQAGLKFFYLIAIQTSADIRFKRLQQRDRSDDPSAWDVFEARDKLESEVGVSDLITKADYKINNDLDISNLNLQIQKFVEWIKNELAKHIKD